MTELKTIQTKKEDSNTLNDQGGSGSGSGSGGSGSSGSGSGSSASQRRRQSLNIKDHFWLVIPTKNKQMADSWFRELAAGKQPMSYLSKRVPVFQVKVITFLVNMMFINYSR